jgi:hypothetical protein
MALFSCVCVFFFAVAFMSLVGVHLSAKVPQAGGVCDVSGGDIPFPGFYMAATDGANFGLREDYYLVAKQALEAELAR